ncbi:UNVERIFIED_CONTAM: hypothetical protein H355_003673, partial [Colinus virginianus]
YCSHYMEFMLFMMQKISLLERKIDKQALEIQMKLWSTTLACPFLLQRFLNDYGLIWVRDRHEEPEDLESLRDDELLAKRLWKPDEAVISKCQIDFDLILENVRSLNVLAGDGVSHIEHVPGGAWLKRPEALPLTLYQNGIIMFDGPFHSYEEPSAQQCLQDIMDGYFPSELQARYPDGVCLQFCKELSQYQTFLFAAEITRFLTVADCRLEATEEADASAPEVCTLRIKSESGEQMYVIKMLFSETVGDLRRHLACARGGDSNSYEIISTFPQRVYVDDSRSLQYCGLIPNASLLLRRPLPSRGDRAANSLAIPLQEEGAALHC